MCSEVIFVPQEAHFTEPIPDHKFINLKPFRIPETIKHRPPFDFTMVFMNLSKNIWPIPFSIVSIVMAYFLVKNRKRILWAHEPFNYKTEFNIIRLFAPGFIYFNLKRFANMVGLFKGHSNAIDYFLKTVRFCPNNVALICSKTGQEWTYRELDESKRLGHILFIDVQ